MEPKVIIDGQYSVVKAFKQSNELFVGVCRRLKDGELLVIKAADGKKLTHEAKINKLLDVEAPEAIRMLEFVPVGLGALSLQLNDKLKLSGFSYMVLPAMTCDLIDLFIQANKKGVELSLEAKRYLSSQVVHCVHYLNVEKQIAHLDLKGENLVLNKDLGVSIIDFGMAEQLGDLLNDRNKMTPGFRAPEIIDKKFYDPAPADVFGLGVCLFQIHVEKDPFGDDMCTTYKKYRECFMLKPKKSLRFFALHGVDTSDVPSRVPYETIIKCFQYDPAHRPTIEEIYEEPYFQARVVTEKVKAELSNLLSEID